MNPKSPTGNQALMADLQALREKSAELARMHPDKAAIILTAWMRQHAQVQKLADEKKARLPKKAG
jgi:hypothetical protein